MQQYRVKNWDEFQHYKDRSPPWIRLHKKLLDNFHFHSLPDASRALAPMLWLLASESKDLNSGLIDGTDEEIAFRLRRGLDEFRQAIKPLVSKGFIEVVQAASEPLATGKQDATPETEAETEAKTEQRQKTGPIPLPDWLPSAEWRDFKELRKRLKAPMTDRAELLAVAELDKLRGQGHDPKLVLEQSIMRGWKGLFPLKTESSKGIAHGKHTGFAEQDYRAGTEGFVVT